MRGAREGGSPGSQISNALEVAQRLSKVRTEN